MKDYLNVNLYLFPLHIQHHNYSTLFFITYRFSPLSKSHIRIQLIYFILIYHFSVKDICDSKISDDTVDPFLTQIDTSFQKQTNFTNQSLNLTSWKPIVPHQRENFVN